MADAITLPPMVPAQAAGWSVLLDVAEAFPDGWCLVGGQMVWLLAAEHGVPLPRATTDIDVVVDVRVRPRGIRDLCRWLEEQGFELEGIDPNGVGHRYVREQDLGRAHVVVDVLAPDHMGARTDLTTTPPARTIQVPGTRTLLQDAEAITVDLDGRVGAVRRPPLLKALVAKARATTIPARTHPARDWADVALLLSIVPEPADAASMLSTAQRSTLRHVDALLDESHPMWRVLGSEAARRGHATLTMLLGRRG